MYLYVDLKPSSSSPSSRSPSPSPVTQSTPKTLTPDEVKKIRKNLFQRYAEGCSEIQTDVFNPHSSIRFEDIYTNLYLVKKYDNKEDDEHDLQMTHPFFADLDARDEEEATKQKRHLPDDEFRKLISPGQPPYRVLLVGEAGVGKTTFLAKFVNDWIKGVDFKDIELLFYISLREAENTNIFGNIVQKYLSETAAYGSRLDEFIKTNQHRAMLLLDGLDEFDGDITGNTENNILAEIMSGDKYKECVVIITARPWRADKILGLPHFKKRFTFVLVEGFSNEGREEYAEKFFHSDQASAASLKEFLAEDNTRFGVYSTIMAPFPIFLAMLCNVWKNESMRKKAMKLQTVSQLTNLMVHVLKEHYALKSDDKRGELFEQCMREASTCLLHLGTLAFPHDPRVKRKLVFDERDFADNKESFETACKVGIVTRSAKVASLETRQRERRRYTVDYRIPHRLILDFLAASYLASVHEGNSPDFNSKLRKLVEISKDDIERFKHVWYFTAAQGRDIGKATLDFLLQEVHNRGDFILRVAFECHDKDIIAPAISTLLKNKSLRIKGKRSLAAYLFALDLSPSLVSEENLHVFWI